MDSEKKPYCIYHVGGEMKEEYQKLESLVEYFNLEFFPLPNYLGLELNLESFLGCIKNGLEYIKTEWVGKETVAELRKEGIPLFGESEELKRRRKSLNATHRAKFTQIYKNYVSEYGAYPSSSPFAKTDSFKIFYPCFNFNKDEGISIDASVFKDIYFSFIDAAQSKTQKAHKGAADAINAFFGVGYKITEQEFFKYFVIDGGRIKPNPTSINRESYARLGKIGRKKVTRIK